jgi:hypothetical protein
MPLPRNHDPTFPYLSHEARGFTKKIAMCEAQNWRCCYCSIPFSDDQRSDAYPTIDHIVPRIAGGRMHWINEAVACALCNKGRGAMRAHRYFEAIALRGRRAAARWGYQQREKRRKEIEAEHANSVWAPLGKLRQQ